MLARWSKGRASFAREMLRSERHTGAVLTSPIVRERGMPGWMELAGCALACLGESGDQSVSARSRRESDLAAELDDIPPVQE